MQQARNEDQSRGFETSSFPRHRRRVCFRWSIVMECHARRVSDNTPESRLGAVRLIVWRLRKLREARSGHGDRGPGIAVNELILNAFGRFGVFRSAGQFPFSLMIELLIPTLRFSSLLPKFIRAANSGGLFHCDFISLNPRGRPGRSWLRHRRDRRPARRSGSIPRVQSPAHR
jgi:hypothetical protein